MENFEGIFNHCREFLQYEAHVGCVEVDANGYELRHLRVFKRFFLRLDLSSCQIVCTSSI